MKRLFGRWNVDDIKLVRRVIVSVVGVTVLLIGIALLVLFEAGHDPAGCPLGLSSRRESPAPVPRLGQGHDDSA